MSLRDVAYEVMVDQRNSVLESTWGHLAPKRYALYPGTITFAIGAYDSGHLNPTILGAEFEGLDDSPWLYQAMNELLQTQRFPVGTVWHWKGLLRNYKFNGRFTQLDIK